MDDYSKLLDYFLTVDGLVYFQTLKGNYILGKELALDDYNKLRLYAYATANKNPKGMLAWQDICITLGDKGIYEKDMFQSKDLKKTKLIAEDPQYNSGLYRKYIEYVKQKINSK